MVSEIPDTVAPFMPCWESDPRCGRDFRAPVQGQPSGLLRLLLIGVAGAALAGCGGPSAPEPAAGTLDPTDGVIAAESFTVPDQVAAGDQFDVTFEESVDRETVYDLYHDDPEVWTARYELFPPGSSGSAPSWVAAGEEVTIASVGLTGTGPDRLVIPQDADPGSDALCVREAVDPAARLNPTRPSLAQSVVANDRLRRTQSSVASDAPPSTTSVWPVIQAASSESRKAVGPAMSAGSPIRPIG